jgi:hypothetical protein
MNTYTARNETWIRTSETRPAYHLAQRVVGYADNDGRWVAQRVAPTHWSRIGTLQRTGVSLVLGVFDTEAEARAAAAADLAVWETEAHTTEAVR